MERNGKPCYANKIAPKCFFYQSYQNGIDKHNCTFMLYKKVTIATIKKRYINTYAPKCFFYQSYQNGIDKHNCTFMLHFTKK